MNKVILEVPIGYEDLTQIEKQFICNGCGAKGGIPVPNSFLGLDISEACNIHDYEYFIGGTKRDKDLADERFLRNLRAIIDGVMFYDDFDFIRHTEADLYYKAVVLWGDDSFVYEKNKKVKL